MPNKKKKTTQEAGTYKVICLDRFLAETNDGNQSFKTQQREAEKARKEEDKEQKRLEKQQAKVSIFTRS